MTYATVKCLHRDGFMENKMKTKIKYNTVGRVPQSTEIGKIKIQLTHKYMTALTFLAWYRSFYFP
jgi:hypothetical protein